MLCDKEVKGVYWLIIGLSIWFVPSIIIQILSDKTGMGVADTLPMEVIVVQFIIAAIVMVKAVITIRKERRSKKTRSRK